MIAFKLELGGVIKIHSMDAETAGKVEFSGVFTVVKNHILFSVGIHGLHTIQNVKGEGRMSIPNDMRHTLRELNIGFEEVTTKGFKNTEVQPIPADEVR